MKKEKILMQARCEVGFLKTKIWDLEKDLGVLKFLKEFWGIQFLKAFRNLNQNIRTQ